jgi:hypothetical protein
VSAPATGAPAAITASVAATAAIRVTAFTFSSSSRPPVCGTPLSLSPTAEGFAESAHQS